MSLYHPCPYCGAHLDPEERCDCNESCSVPCPEEVLRIRDRIKAQVAAERQAALEAQDSAGLEIRGGKT